MPFTISEQVRPIKFLSDTRREGQATPAADHYGHVYKTISFPWF